MSNAKSAEIEKVLMSAAMVLAAFPLLLLSLAVSLSNKKKHRDHNVGVHEDLYGVEGLYCFDCKQWIDSDV